MCRIGENVNQSFVCMFCIHCLISLKVEVIRSQGNLVGSCYFCAQLAENSHKVHLTRRNLVL